MDGEWVSATTVISASPDAVFRVLTDPSQHAAIDGTGWVCEPVDDRPITSVGQVFWMSMYHSGHPDGRYATANEVLVLEPQRTIMWRPGYQADDSGELAFGGWTWRYDLSPLGPDATEVTHTYDWSQVGPGPRTYLRFPPFPPDHLDTSLRHLAGLVAAGVTEET